MEPLTCPKCQGEMRVYERNGVTVDQCTQCRGIFLDRGELERLIDAETRYTDADQTGPTSRTQPPPASAPAVPAYGTPPPAAAGGYPQPPASYPPGYPPGYEAPRRRGFLEGLFGEDHEDYPRRRGGHHGGHH